MIFFDESRMNPILDKRVNSMRTHMIVACLAIALIAGLIGPRNITAEDSQNQALEKAEARLRQIYVEGTFRAKSFSAEWLPDGSGYTVRETDPDSNRSVRAQYDAASGRRTVIESRRRTRGGNRSPDGKRVLNYENNNLHVRDLTNDRKIQLTKNEHGRTISYNNAIWSPDGKRIAYIEQDHSDVRLRSVLVKNDPSYPQVRETRFARVGEAITKLRVGIVDAEGGDTLWLSITAPAEGFYLGQVSWGGAGNSNELLVEKFSRFRDVREFLIADIRSGAVTQMYHESDPAWVISSLDRNTGLEWIRNGNAFIVLSEKDGWRHAYVCSRDGKEETLLTPGPSDIIERVMVDEAGGWFYYNASPDNGTQKYLYRVRLDGSGETQRVTPEDQPGTHDYDLSPNANWAFHKYSTFDIPPITELVRLSDHRVMRVLEDNKELREKMAALIKHPTEFVQLDIGDVVMDASIIKPSDFDPSKKYPVFVYVYGEPHGQTVMDSWAFAQADYHRMIADLGYVVVSIDNRGTPAPKGAAWRRAVAGNLGTLSTEEQAAGLQVLGRTWPYVDLSRVGIWGWSGGGSNTLNAMFRKPDVYHVGIAVAAKPQPHLYNAWFQEMYMKDRKVNPEGYRQAAAINFAAGLKGDLLIIHGTGETNTHIEIMEGLVDKLIELGKPFEYMNYPNRNHGIRSGPGTSVHLRMYMARYLLEHLPAGPR